MPARADVRLDASIGDDFTDVARLLQRSLIFGLVDGVLGVARRAVEGSRFVALVRARLISVAQLRREERVRIVALFFVTASAAELILAAFIPERSAPAMPRALWLLTLVTAGVPTAVPRSALAAWDHWSLRTSRTPSTRRSGA